MKQKLEQNLHRLKQEHLCRDLASLDQKELNALFLELKKIEQTPLLRQEKVSIPSSIKPLEKLPFIKEGIFSENLLRNGQIGCIVLAGGEGSRLGFSKSKGIYPIYKGKSLFQILCEKILKHQKKFSSKFYLAILVSPLSREQVVSFFEGNQFFGLEKDQIDFFEQDLYPYEDKEGKWFWQEKGRLAQGPLGNGKVFFHFVQQSVFQKWKKKGILHAGLISIDNPLANPFDPKLIAIHQQTQSDITLTAIPKEEKTGGLVLLDGIPRIIEYDCIKNSSLESVSVFWGNAGIYLFSMRSIKEMAAFPIRAVKVKKETTKLIEGKKEKVFAFKWEYRLFDAFFVTNKVTVYPSSKDRCFAPLKSKADILNVQKALKQTFEDF